MIETLSFIQDVCLLYPCGTLLQPEAHDIIGLSIRTVGLPGYPSGRIRRKTGDGVQSLGWEGAVENDNPLQYSFEIPWKGTWQATVPLGFAESQP